MHNEPEQAASATGTATAMPPRYLHVIIDGNDPKDGEPVHVNVRVPIALLRFGARFANFIPPSARQQVNDELRTRGMDVDVSQITAKDIDELVENLKDLSIDVEHKQDNIKVKFFAE